MSLRGSCAPAKTAPLSAVALALAGLAVSCAPALAQSPREPESPPGARRAPAATVPSPRAPGAAAAPSGPRLAIVIDDLGESTEQLAPFLAVPLPLSFAVLPTGPEAPRVARVLARRGSEVLVHLPMEPLEADHISTPGFLTTGMDDATLRAVLARDLERVPGAKGVNNHMGSRFTRDGARMAVVARVLKAKGLYFLDSRTDAGTVAHATCQAEGLPSLQRDVFLDNDPSEDLVLARLQEAATLAGTKGFAIAIGHPRPETAAALARFARDPGVDVVPLSALLP